MDRREQRFRPVNCDFLNPAANGECGPGNPAFLKQISPLTTDPALTGGWNYPRVQLGSHRSA